MYVLGVVAGMLAIAALGSIGLWFWMTKKGTK